MNREKLYPSRKNVGEALRVAFDVFGRLGLMVLLLLDIAYIVPREITDNPSAPAWPLLIILMAIGVAWIWQIPRKRRKPNGSVQQSQ